MANLKIAFLLLSALTVAGSASAQERPPVQPPFIAVTGTGTARVDPDMATVRVGVQNQAKTALEAQNQTNAVSQRILEAITKLGIERRDVQTSSLSLFPVFGNTRPDERGNPIIVGYRAVNTVSVRVQDLKKVGPVIDATTAAGANEVQGVEFGLKDDAAARRAALKAAVAQARDKAGIIAEALEMRLMDPLEVNEGGVQMGPMPMMARAALMDSAAAPVSPGQVEITATVTIRYRFGR